VTKEGPKSWPVAWVRTVKTASEATAARLCGPRARLASIEHLGSVHDERELESLKAAARQRAAGHVFTSALARRRLLEAAGLTFSVAVSSYG
jgi:hypothetical protein